MEIFASQPSLVILAGIGLVSGVLSGIFGIGGGILIVPALMYLAGFDQHLAIGTSLAVLLPPVGLGAVLEYYRFGKVDLRAGVIIAASLVVGGWLGAAAANRIAGPYVRLAFGAFVLALGAFLTWQALRSLGGQ